MARTVDDLDAFERDAILRLEGQIVTDSPLYRSGATDPRVSPPWFHEIVSNPDARVLAGDDPRLAKMPKLPTLVDYFTYRFGPSQHLLQSARLAKRNGCDEKIVLACLLHDISVVGMLVPDHGYWGAQLIEPYVDEEVSWAVRYHQALRFYPDLDAGYDYPDMYIKWFGEDYKVDDYIERDYQFARNHKWYMSARQVTVNDLYAFDPNVVVEVDEFVDIIGRHFRQPEEGLGFDNSPSAHMWRTIMRPTKFL
ncbi:MAG: hypothetical protein ACI9W2_001098 [Gammaproteobacteria bacterium]|jgi:hypothetical protein